MPAGQIYNPANAYGVGTDPSSGQGVVAYFESAEASTTISAGQAVTINTSRKILQATTAVEKRLVIGVATEDITAGSIGPVAVHGLVRNVKAQGAIAAGDAVQGSGTTAGSVATVASASTEIGRYIGIAVTAAASSLVDVYVQKF